jgi:hypothetical protein
LPGALDDDGGADDRRLREHRRRAPCAGAGEQRPATGRLGTCSGGDHPRRGIARATAARRARQRAPATRRDKLRNLSRSIDEWEDVSLATDFPEA